MRPEIGRNSCTSQVPFFDGGRNSILKIQPSSIEQFEQHTVLPYTYWTNRLKTEAKKNHDDINWIWRNTCREWKRTQWMCECAQGTYETPSQPNRIYLYLEVKSCNNKSNESTWNDPKSIKGNMKDNCMNSNSCMHNIVVSVAVFTLAERNTYGRKNRYRPVEFAMKSTSDVYAVTHLSIRAARP